jgi:putative transposase
MTNYRRFRVPGGTYFFTVNLKDRRSDLLVRHVDLLRQAMREALAHAPFQTDAFVVLPEHLHAIWTLPEGDFDFSKRWRNIKTIFSRHLPKGEAVSPSRVAKGERGIWQRRFWEHAIRDEADYRTHVGYVHFNPVKHGLVTNAADWPYSSFHRCVRAGLYPPDWGGMGADLDYAGEWSSRFIVAST